MKVYYGNRSTRRGVDDVAFRMIRDLVMAQPGETKALPDIVVFDVPRSGITRPGVHEKFKLEIGTRGESISVKALTRQKTLARYELRHPLKSTSFNHVEVVDEEWVCDRHLLRRDQAAFSDVAVLMDRTTHSIFCGGKKMTYLFERRWGYPFTDSLDEGAWFLGCSDFLISVEGEYSVEEAIEAFKLNLPKAYDPSLIMTYRCYE